MIRRQQDQNTRPTQTEAADSAPSDNNSISGNAPRSETTSVPLPVSSAPVGLDRRRSSRDPYALAVSSVAIDELKAESYDDGESEPRGKGKDEAEAEIDDGNEAQGSQRQQSRRTLWKNNAKKVQPGGGEGENTGAAYRNGGIMGDSFTGGAASSFRVSSGPLMVVSSSTSPDKTLKMRGRCRNGTPSDVFGWMGSFSVLDESDACVAADRVGETDSEPSPEREEPVSTTGGGGGPNCTARMRGRTRNGTPSDLFGWEGSFSSVTSSK